MYLIIEKLNFVNISPSFNVVSYSKDKDLADRYAQCKRDEANEQGKENYSYDVVLFMDLEDVKEFNKSSDLGLNDVN
jgi:hypothetical protein